ncbi:hypothetical protein RJ639_047213 [Escallonia herrerae]|uniref:Amino acid transporter n=1 Tax=Escallonia herrerae TaxID=1293975 RepID=A0AA88W5A6_9ASTE|nr:hypothetical protein RJ639_047213 [Escallonia herrerae]
MMSADVNASANSRAMGIDSGEKHSIQDTRDYVLKHGSVHWNTFVWTEPALCRACKLNMGMGCRYILHLESSTFYAIHSTDDEIVEPNTNRPPVPFTFGLLIWLDQYGGHSHHGAVLGLKPSALYLALVLRYHEFLLLSSSIVIGFLLEAYSGSQALQMIILLSTGTNKGGGYLAPKSIFLCIYMALILMWAILNSFALKVIAYLNILSIWWQILGGMVVIIMLPLVATSTQPASYVFTHFKMAPESTGISSKPYAVIMSVLLSNYCLYGYDTAAHLTEETKGADKTGPIAILSSIGIITVFGWAYNLALTFSIRDPSYLYDKNNETAGSLVPAQIIYDAFYGRYQNSTGAVVFLCIIWGSFFFCGLSVTTSAARVVYALSRDNGIPFSPIWRRLHPKHKVPINAVWLCAAIAVILGLPILKLNVIFNAIISISTIGWVGGYAVPIFARLIMVEEDFKPGPFYLGKARRPICLVAFLWICYTCAAFLLPSFYPITWDTFNYAPVALGVSLTLIMLWWGLDARKWFTGPSKNRIELRYLVIIRHSSPIKHAPVLSQKSISTKIGNGFTLYTDDVNAIETRIMPLRNAFYPDPGPSHLKYLLTFPAEVVTDTDKMPLRGLESLRSMPKFSI